MTGSSHRGSSFTERMGTSGTIGSSFGDLSDTAREKAQDMASHVSQFADDMRERAQHWASSFMSGAGDTWESTSREARHLASRVADTAENAWDDVGRFVRRHPVPTLLIAVSLGFMLNELMSRNR